VDRRSVARRRSVLPWSRLPVAAGRNAHRTARDSDVRDLRPTQRDAGKTRLPGDRGRRPPVTDLLPGELRPWRIDRVTVT